MPQNVIGVLGTAHSPNHFEAEPLIQRYVFEQVSEQEAGRRLGAPEVGE